MVLRCARASAIISSSAAKFSDFKHIVGKREIFGQNTIERYFVIVSTVELRTLYIQELPHKNTFCECILKKIGPKRAHFQYNARKLMSFKSVLL